ncbi:MAG TPA: biopolymer transporter ExbD [Candidatus Obscuribacter sp.]|nr:biopolymer transporter ExbD [Candidatus Melainabacteria bacterium]MDX1986842.1 biopolymer transporter ExbD [Candidatus Obscuribacter sp.]HMW91395.1 biopolymer transporter ExbD [Candidatus Obscuribacter sp.]HMX47862.1 biopolymer transporter ExbD [Candidatus Obscuribacter sp.]HNA72552.1 biopolymer transporter ExbD [Candidatus Obscuribacter sp.]
MSMGAVGDQFTDINVTPLTDVFLVLLVIMILIAPLIDKSDLKIKPPETKNAKKDEATKGISIDIDKDGQLAINGKYVRDHNVDTIKAMILELKNAAQPGTDLHLTLNADGDAKQKDVVEVMSAAAAAGITKMRVATQQQTNY